MAFDPPVALERTGGLLATALFDADGTLSVLREDVGRHDALDKAIGSMLLAGRYPLPGAFACLSGRASFESVRGASLAGLAGLVAVGAPSSLAVDLALSGECFSAASSVGSGSTSIRATIGWR